jgi:hypothetical protein
MTILFWIGILMIFSILFWTALAIKICFFTKPRHDSKSYLLKVPFEEANGLDSYYGLNTSNTVLEKEMVTHKIQSASLPKVFYFSSN